MDEQAVAAIRAWVTKAGLKGADETELVRGFCDRVAAAGMRLVQGQVIIDTLHPVHGGRMFLWRRDGREEVDLVTEYGRSSGDNDAWMGSPFHALLESGDPMLRRNFARGDPADFERIAHWRQRGYTDYLAFVHRFAADRVIGDMDCVYSAWSSDAAAGFADGDVEQLAALLPTLALAVKCASMTRIAGTLVETYLGRDAGRRVLSGRIARGVTDRIGAVLWYSDLRGYTRISDGAAPEEIIPFLNDYAEAVISGIHEAGGDVLKLIGDGTLAVFTATDPAAACVAALRAEALAREHIETLNLARAAEGLPVTQAYLGLHVGDVFYGNIGSSDRLDFTVVGPAVNEVARIAAMCRSAEQDVLLSSAFVEQAAPEDRQGFVSVGRYALRGVGRPQELFTLECRLRPVTG